TPEMVLVPFASLGLDETAALSEGRSVTTWDDSTALLAEERWRALEALIRTHGRFIVLERLSAGWFPVARCRDEAAGVDLAVRYIVSNDSRLGATSPLPPPDIFRTGNEALVISLFIEGISLIDELTRGEFLDPPAIADFLRQGRNAIAALHEREWVHGDIGPHNFRRQAGELVLVGELWSEAPWPHDLPSWKGVMAGTPLRALGVDTA